MSNDFEEAFGDFLERMCGGDMNKRAVESLIKAGAFDCFGHRRAQLLQVYDKAMEDVDAVMCLRLQLERQQAGLLPDLTEYASRFCVTARHLAMAAPGAPLLHPGPINRGLEIASDLADAPQSRILDQVTAGVAVRMAVLFTLGMREAGYE